MVEPAIADDDDEDFVKMVLDNTDDPQELCYETLTFRVCSIENHLELHPEDKEVLAPKLEELEQEWDRRKKEAEMKKQAAVIVPHVAT